MHAWNCKQYYVTPLLFSYPPNLSTIVLYLWHFNFQYFARIACRLRTVLVRNQAIYSIPLSYPTVLSWGRLYICIGYSKIPATLTVRFTKNRLWTKQAAKSASCQKCIPVHVLPICQVVLHALVFMGHHAMSNVLFISYFIKEHPCRPIGLLTVPGCPSQVGVWTENCKQPRTTTAVPVLTLLLYIHVLVQPRRVFHAILASLSAPHWRRNSPYQSV